MKYDLKACKFIETEIDPTKLAIAGSDTEIDWQTLKIKTEKLAELFKELHIPQGNPIIIYGHKECFYPLVILACIHSKTTYIPIDRIYPVERIKKIIEITGAQVLINCSNQPLDVEIAITIDADLKQTIHHSPDHKTKTDHDPSDPLQYIMFTSGSTGEPKGVQITRNSILAFIDWVKKDFSFSSDDVFMNQAPFTFDVSLCDVLNTFAHGASLVLISTDMVKDQNEFFDRLNKYKCSVWTSTPSFVFLFLRHPDFKTVNIPSLRTFLFIGEELPNRTCASLKNSFANARILNAYGPTEATIVTTLIEITNDIIKKYPLLPIGYPMDGSILYVEKSDPNEKEGELIIVGEHVSIGYFKREEFNKEKFFTHKGMRAFRSGDVAYYEDGMLFCLGRNDDQIKMNGFRIELNEISQTICKNNLVSDAVTVALKRNNEVKKIISFVMMKTPIEKEELLKELMPSMEKSLPYYMIPGDISIVSNFPYSSSHKIDKNKLIEEYLKKQFNS